MLWNFPIGLFFLQIFSYFFILANNQASYTSIVNTSLLLAYKKAWAAILIMWPKYQSRYSFLMRSGQSSYKMASIHMLLLIPL